MDGRYLSLVDFMGGDHSIINAARVSFGNGTKGEEKDKKLIRFLLRNHHTSPFEHVIFTFRVKCPIFVARQWMRHRTWSYNEISYRYTEPDFEFYHPETWREQSDNNRQASGDAIDERGESAANITLNLAIRHSVEQYRFLIDRVGVSREQARMVLPMNLMTTFYATVDLHNLLHFIKLRRDQHAQIEIREYAERMIELIRPVVPWTMEIWEDLNVGGS